MDPKSEDDRVGFFVEREKRLMRYRNEGLRFMADFPNDPRCWDWLVNTYSTEPFYYADLDAGAEANARGMRPKDIPRDEEASQRWETLFHGVLRNALLGSTQATDSQRARLIFFETSRIFSDVTSRFGSSPELLPRTAEDVAWVNRRLSDYLAGVLAYAELVKGDEHEVLLGGLVTHLNQFFIMAGRDLAGREEAVGKLLVTTNVALREKVSGLWQQLDLRRRPLDFRRETIDGRPFDLASLRGKIVLLDFWSTSCASCIGEMPHVKEVFDRYRPQGFEVVSICLDEQKNRKRIGQIVERVDADWPVILESWSETPLRQRFNFTFVPVLMMLDRNGLLVSLDARGEKLEPAVRRLLGLDPGCNGAPNWDSPSPEAGSTPLR